MQAPRAAANSKAAQAAAGMDDSQIVPVQVIVNNGTGQPTQQKQSKGNNGGNIVELFIGEAAKSIVNGQVLGQTIANTFGLNRAGTRRA